MPFLTDIENAVVSNLTAATISGSPAFATVQGISGGYRAALRDALRRDRTPAAYIGFTEEPTAPEVKQLVRGAKIAVLIVESVLREGSNPRVGDVSTKGIYQLLDLVRQRLDDNELVTGYQFINLHQKFVDGDDRIAVYEILYRAWPLIYSELAELKFDGESILGTDSRMIMEVGPIGISTAEFSYHGSSGLYRKELSSDLRTVVWRGQLRAPTHIDLTSIEDAIEVLVHTKPSASIDEGGFRFLDDCAMEAFFRHGGRRT